MEFSKNKIDQKTVDEAQRLSEAIMTLDLAEIQNKIKYLIKKRVIVQITAVDRRFICDYHNQYYRGENPSFSRFALYWASSCSYQHKFCLKCIKTYLQDKFTTNYFNNRWRRGAATSN